MVPQRNNKTNLRSNISKLLMLSGVLLFVPSCAMNDAEVAVSSGDRKSLVKDLRNFHKVNDYLYRGGMPTEDGIQALHDSGIDTIVDLRREPVGIKLEKHVATTLGMEHISLPSGNTPPSFAKLAKFVETVRKAKRAKKNGELKPVFVHCNAGCDRTSVYIAFWRVLDEGWHPLAAYLEMLRYGFLIHHLEFPVTSDADKWIAPSAPYDMYNPKK